MKVEILPIAEFTADPENARLHDDRNLEAIARSLKAFGQQKPIVVDRDGIIVAGNGTVAAASSLGWTEVAVVRTGLDKDEARAYAIADNRTAELATWDEERLALTLGELDIDLAGAVGFSEEELAAMLEPFDASEVVEEEPTPEPPADPITKPGDLWLLGEHRLLCGDSTKAEDVSRLMAGQTADLLLTDPPYNVDYTGKTKDALKVKNDAMEDGAFRQFLVSAFQAAFDAMRPGASFYVFHADSEGFNFRGAINDCGETVRQCLIWVKQTLVMGRQDYQWQHEPCLYGWKEGAAHSWYADRKQTTLLKFDRPTRSSEHPTMKPVEMVAYLMGNSSKAKSIVLDLFLGSGTTLIASEQMGRVCYGMELDPAYCDVVVQRWESLTGQEAKRVESE